MSETRDRPRTTTEEAELEKSTGTLEELLDQLCLRIEQVSEASTAWFMERIAHAASEGRMDLVRESTSNHVLHQFDIFAEHWLTTVLGEGEVKIYEDKLDRWVTEAVETDFDGLLLTHELPAHDDSKQVQYILLAYRLWGRVSHWRGRALGQVRELKESQWHLAPVSNANATVESTCRDALKQPEEHPVTNGFLATRRLSRRDEELYIDVGSSAFRNLTNPEITKRYHRGRLKQEFRTTGAFRSSLNRIRSARHLPSSENVKKNGQR